MISKGDYWREITALNERAAKAEYALAYERHRASLLTKTLEEIYLYAFDAREAFIANTACEALQKFEAQAVPADVAGKK